MNRIQPGVHCERCGVPAIAKVGASAFCLSCGLYVCAGCWRESVLSCASCAALHTRPSRRTHILTLRRWDRRVREVIRAVAAFDVIAPDASELRREHAWLVLRADSVERAGEAALARLPRVRLAARVAPLVRRIRRHEVRMRSWLDGLGDAVAGLDARGWRDLPAQSTGVDEEPGTTNRRPAAWAALATGALTVVAAAVLAPGWFVQLSLDEARVGEGIFGGGPDGGVPVQGWDAFADAGPSHSATPAATPSASPGSFLFDFDTVRMGEGIGAG